MIKKRPVLLMILDGYGLSDEKAGNAIAAAKKPNIDGLFSKYPHSRLVSSGESVGLPEGQMGNSEVGHLNIGTGRIVYQDLTKISKSICDGEFFKNKSLIDAMENVRNHDNSLHFIGLLSDGGVHSHTTHLYALLEMAKQQGIKKVYVHAFLDGRDVPPKSALAYIEQTEKKMSKLVGEFATISGRYFAMDRDMRWERVEKAYDAMTLGIGVTAKNAGDALKNAYDRGETDEFVTPAVIIKDKKPISMISNNDSIIFFNFRSDRAREITRALTDDYFSGFKRRSCPQINFVCFTQYDETFNVAVAFRPEPLRNILSEIISRHHLRQLRIAETEKYAHVTFFFNGGVEVPFNGEDRILIQSPKVPTYDLQPEMSAFLVTEEVGKSVSSGKYDIIILNYANCDMVGHTGVFKAAVKAVEAIDQCIEMVFESVKKVDGLLIITADHGNAEKMINNNGEIHTAHTSNDVPFLICDESIKLGNGILADIAPTILEVLGIEKPEEMTGKSLIERL
jgi:2,3-bisphosphoglycerate-independent phosphoglycerate mutase